MEEGRFLSTKEAQRYAVVERVIRGELTVALAAEQMRLSRRQVLRLSKRVRCQGAAGLISQRRGQPSKRRIAQSERTRIMGVVREQYADFGPLLAWESLHAHHSFEASVETLRGWMIADGLWRPRQHRAKRVHPSRARRPRLGELVQIDGSHHAWFEQRGAPCCLIAFIDDATGRVLGARFSPTETTQDYFEVLRSYVLAHGVPLALYSDRHSIFTQSNGDEPSPTQFERALLQLDIEAIQARTPQAKGRVERLFQTLQDRMCKAMRLAGISDIDSANAWLGEHLRGHNARFAVQPADPQDAHRPWHRLPSDLACICALHHQRQLGHNLSCRFEGSVVQVQAHQSGLPKGKAQIDIVQHRDDRLELFYHGQPLAYTRHELHPHLCQAKAADHKTLNQRVDTTVSRARREIAKLMAELDHQNAQRAQGTYRLGKAANAMPSGY